MAIWIIMGVLMAVLASAFTLIWWKVGDQWADDEYKKFGHGGGAPRGADPTVIRDFDNQTDQTDQTSEKPQHGDPSAPL